MAKLVISILEEFLEYIVNIPLQSTLEVSPYHIFKKYHNCWLNENPYLF